MVLKTIQIQRRDVGRVVGEEQGPRAGGIALGEKNIRYIRKNPTEVSRSVHERKHKKPTFL